MAFTRNIEDADELIRLAQYDRVLAEYNDAYYKWVFGPEKDEKENSEKLAKMRHIYFSL
jgi:hypothetical protein